MSSARDVKPRLGSVDTPIYDLFKLTGRTILITGGGGSVGLEVARACLELGADVVCIDRQEEPLEEPWQRVVQAAHSHNATSFYHSCDVTDPKSIDQALNSAETVVRYPYGGLVCCAGLSGSGDGPAISTTVERMKNVVDVNYVGTFLCAQAMAQKFKEQNTPGSMVFIASMSGHVCNKGVETAAYNSSKAAVLQLTRSLAGEWGSSKDFPLIRVNSVSPGYIKTRLTEESLKEPGKGIEWADGNMLNRLSYADEYRGAVTFLLSDASSFVTGTDIKVDGGHTAF